jgi:hypothetical protein
MAFHISGIFTEKFLGFLARKKEEILLYKHVRKELRAVTMIQE